MVRVWSCVIVVAVFAASAVLAQSPGEHLILLPPLPGYAEAPFVKNDDYTVSQWLPVGQSVDNWLSALTVKSYAKQAGVVPSVFAKTDPVKGWIPDCTGGFSSQQLANYDATASSFASAMWRVSCANSSATGKPENTWYKAIQGGTFFYVIDWTFRYNPTNDQQAQAVKYLNLIVACDFKSTEHPCPTIADVLPLSVTPQSQSPGSGTSPPAAAPAAPNKTQ